MRIIILNTNTEAAKLGYGRSLVVVAIGLPYLAG